MKKLIVFLISLSACGANNSSNLESTNRANPCATPGATYIVHFTETSGDCGPIADELININSDGTLTNTFVCEKITQTACTARDTNCTSIYNGVTCSFNTAITFAADGSIASGYESVSCHTATDTCTSNYQVTSIRQ